MAKRCWMALAMVVSMTWCRADPAKVRLEDGVQCHLDYARQLLASGQPAEAWAHTDVLSFRRSLRVACPELGYSRSVKQAISVWNASLGYEAFVLAEGSQAPDVRLRFVKVLKQGQEEIAGLTNWRREVTYTPVPEGLLSANVQVRTTLLDGGSMPRRAVTSIVLHELGHVLGLADGDVGVMGSLDPSHPCLRPSEAEIAALSQMFSQTRQLRCACLAFGVMNLRGVH